MLTQVFLFATFFSILHLPAWSSIVAKSTMNECTAYGGSELKNSVGAPCKQKLVVAMTVSANEGSSQKIEANIARVTDATGKDIKNVQLQHPIRITINKSPVLINYRLYQIGYVSNYPHEVVVPKRTDRCRDDWYAGDWEIACSFARDSNNQRIFDSQGTCCHCNTWGKQFYRGSSANCAHRHNQQIGHCLKFDQYNYYVFGLYPPDLQFTITIAIQRLSYNRENGEEVWEDVSTLEIGPQRRVASSDEYQVKAEYIADFNPSEFVHTAKLANRYLLIPDNSILKLWPHVRPYVFHGQSETELTQFRRSLKNASEWMAVPKPMFDLTRSSCDKIGVGYSAFRHQPSLCTSKIGSCLRNQPFLLWRQEKEAHQNGVPGQYMLHNFGKLHSVPHTRDITDYQVNFIANRPTKSLITISMVADDMTVVVHKSPGRIVEAYIDSFEALATTGTLVTLVQNIGSYTATYNVFVVHCSAGIDMVPALSVTLDPNQLSNVSFVMHSFHAIGNINHCTLELNDMDGDLLDNMTVAFETLDTCFCYGYCGCAVRKQLYNNSYSCGDSNTTCPEPPDIDGDPPHIEHPFPPDWLTKLGDIFKIAGPSVLMGIWFLWLLSCLGGLKILHMIITGDVKFPEPVTIALSVVLQILQKFFKEWFPRAFQACGTCCEKMISCCFVCTFCVLTAGKSRKEEALVRKVGHGWRIPRNCNGMCKGAKFARRKHRKLMRINKRKGMKNDTPWYQKPYKCTCKVKDNMPCLKIIKGLFFFHYCLCLPLIWTLHYLWVFVKRKWKRHKRKKNFRQSRDAESKAEDQTYLQLDKYSRGKIEREILDLSQDIKNRKREKLKQENKGFHPEDDHLELLESYHDDTTEAGSSDEDADKVYASSDNDSSDTSDADEVGDIEELLLTPGHPVYFNYPLPKNLPPSIQNPGKMLSIQGRLRTSEKDKGQYIFDLHKYTYQVKEIRSGKIHILDTPRLLPDLTEFEHGLNKEKALQLVTIAPLFPCLNDTTTFVMKIQSKAKPPS